MIILYRSGLARLETLAEQVLGQVAADEDQPALPLLVGFPGPLPVAIEQHVNPLDDEALVVVLQRQNALHAQQVGAVLLRDVLDPGHEPVRLDRTVCAQRQAHDLIIALVLAVLCQEARLDLENAIEVECVLAKRIAEIDRAALRAVDLDVRIDGATARFDARRRRDNR
jgi:hypothetical protein